MSQVKWSWTATGGSVNQQKKALIELAVARSAADLIKKDLTHAATQINSAQNRLQTVYNLIARMGSKTWTLVPIVTPEGRRGTNRVFSKPFLLLYQEADLLRYNISLMMNTLYSGRTVTRNINLVGTSVRVTVTTGDNGLAAPSVNHMCG